jgi:2-hydroxycyclohexanecarboxyl-CoA dehydrogenase
MTDPVEKVAIVTGGASGIGLAIAQRLAGDGAKVAIFDLDADNAEDQAAKIRADGGAALAARVDVSDREQIQDAVDAVHEKFGAVTILVNNAGMEGFQPFLKISTENWNRLLAVNLTAARSCCPT